MRIHGLMVVRDEGDLIAQSLDHVLGWIDSLYVLDTGSTDATWDIVNDYARRDRRVTPFLSKPLIFEDNLRGLLFHKFRSLFAPGDWVMRLDADEFYHTEPPTFVRECLRPLDSCVYYSCYYFRLTQQECADYESGRVSVSEDRTRPIAERRRHYKISAYAEPRMFRYRQLMQWPHDASFPFNAGYVSRHRIPMRHYPHRDPPQMERRFRLRAAMMKLKAGAGGHWRLDDWRRELVDTHGIAEAAKDGQGLAGESGVDTGPLLYWAPGTDLPPAADVSHLPAIPKRAVQRLIHPAMLPLLDRLRSGFDPHFSPREIPRSELP